MRRFNGTELGLLALAVLFLTTGAVTALHPTEFSLYHQAYRYMSSGVDHFTKAKSRCAGILLVFLGSGMIWLVALRRNK